MDIAAVARRAGVSTATVSRVINSSSKVRENTAAKVRAAIEELNYRPNSSARCLRSGRSNLFGIIVSDIRNPFFPDLIEHFELLATQHGIDVTIANTGYNEQRLVAAVRRFFERGIDGLAIFTSEVSNATIELLRSADVPVVFLNQPALAGDFRTVTVDYIQGFVEAIEHLRMLGHKKIGFLAGPVTQNSANRRRKAFLAAMKACDLSLRDEWIFEGDHRLTGGRFAAERLFTMRNAPTALVCSNDMMAIGFLETASRLERRVPDEVSLIGFDDLFVCEVVHPALTTLHLSRKEIATRAFYALQASRNESLEHEPAVISPYLVPRASTGSVARLKSKAG
ncbi:MAG: LacI family DNA-binding transcriptional regulator [Edaphobacter sp.]|uniref:LacI family DNA-binding transcriptional regulator n=1 Tax=Edaphobacter sp. TaxID=1934404 RepID=UPI002396E92C|nr:LacI family DNA-binding transcriptional regulator [Edaphobacter sp.]MDE1178053.1 LacI family DNA-binding transcriptional regulator [Edaphobacter sp.]